MWECAGHSLLRYFYCRSLVSVVWKTINNYSPEWKWIIVLVNTKPVKKQWQKKKNLPAEKVITHYVLPTSGYHRLVYVYTKPVNSVFYTLWLATQAQDILSTALQEGVQVITFPAEFWPDKIYFLSLAIHWFGIIILTQLFTSVSVNSGGYLPRLFKARWIIIVRYLELE